MRMELKYLWILQKQPDGSWRIARAIYNVDG
jgi:ketosteroid isomerase-like protein